VLAPEAVGAGPPDSDFNPGGLNRSPGRALRHIRLGYRPRNRSGEIQFHFIHETPSPVFSRLKGAHDRMLGPVKMLGRMLVLR